MFKALSQAPLFTAIQGTTETSTLPGMSGMTYVQEQFDHLFQVGKSVYIRLTSQKDGCHQNLYDCARGKRDFSARHVGLDRMTRGKSTKHFGIAALKPSTKQTLTILSRKRMTWLQRLMVATAGGPRQKAKRLAKITSPKDTVPDLTCTSSS